MAAGLIIGETWRSARSSAKRRDGVDEQLEALGTQVGALGERIEALVRGWGGGARTVSIGGFWFALRSVVHGFTPRFHCST